MYEIIGVSNSDNFANSNGSINQQVLGKYVHDLGGDRVLQRDNKFLICQIVEEATLITK
jgi:hypothetical protein